MKIVHIFGKKIQKQTYCKPTRNSSSSWKLVLELSSLNHTTQRGWRRGNKSWAESRMWNGKPKLILQWYTYILLGAGGGRGVHWGIRMGPPPRLINLHVLKNSLLKIIVKCVLAINKWFLLFHAINVLVFVNIF